MTPEEMLARLLYRDGLMLVIDKPAGLHVHRGPKGGPSLEDYFEPLRFGLPRNPALAHRLDKDTSGCLVLGRHRKALALLGKLFKQGKVGKIYWAVVEGALDAEEGRIDIPLGKVLRRAAEQRGGFLEPTPQALPPCQLRAVVHAAPVIAVTRPIVIPGHREAVDPESRTGFRVHELRSRPGMTK